VAAYILSYILTIRLFMWYNLFGCLEEALNNGREGNPFRVVGDQEA
jgi:hypothetical protein